MIQLSVEAEKQLEALVAYYVAKQRPEAITNLVAAVRQTSDDIEQGKAAGLSAPRPYPHLAHRNEQWTKSGSYWFAYTTLRPPVILAVFTTKRTSRGDVDGRASSLTARAALYYAPEIDDPLWRAGCDWLGRDPASGRVYPHSDRDELTAEPRRYGFHATLKPPMRLAHPWYALVEDAAALAARLAPFDLPRLEVADISGFLALHETAPCPPLQALADACVTEVDAHRVPAGPEEVARRRRAELTARQDAMLLDWGYPYVLTTWRFHMTLTRRLSEQERSTALPAAIAHFAAACALPRRVTSICLFSQAAPGSPFLLAERLPLGG